MVAHLERKTLELEKKAATFEARANLVRSVPMEAEHWAPTR